MGSEAALDPAEGMTEYYRNGPGAAMADFFGGLRMAPSWWILARNQTISAYRRTVLGPWWMTLQRAVYIAALSYLFGVLGNHDPKVFVPYVAVGVIFFQFVMGSLTDGAGAIVRNTGVLRSAALPTSFISFRVVSSHLIQFAHDLVVLLVVLAVAQVPIGINTLIAAGCSLFVIVNSYCFTLWLGPATARYRDILPLVSSLGPMLMFFTPIFWIPTNSARTSVIADINPLRYLLDAVRYPLLGYEYPPSLIYTAAIITALNVLVASWVFSATRLRLLYWVQS